MSDENLRYAVGLGALLKEGRGINTSVLGISQADQTINLLGNGNQGIGLQRVVSVLETAGGMPANLENKARAFLYEASIADISTVQNNLTDSMRTRMYMDDEMRKAIGVTVANFIQLRIDTNTPTDYFTGIANGTATLVNKGDYKNLPPLHIAAYLGSDEGKQLLGDKKRLEIAKILVSSMYSGLARTRLVSMVTVNNMLQAGTGKSDLAGIFPHQQAVRSMSDMLSPMEIAYSGEDYYQEFLKIKQFQSKIVQLQGPSQGNTTLK